MRLNTLFGSGKEAREDQDPEGSAAAKGKEDSKQSGAVQYETVEEGLTSDTTEVEEEVHHDKPIRKTIHEMQQEAN